LGREGENIDAGRSTLVDFDQWSKSTHKYFWISQIALSTQRYFET